MASLWPRPETGQHKTLRAESPQAYTVVMPLSSRRRQISGTFSILIQCICTSWRVVRSRKLFPKCGLGTGPRAKSAAILPTTLVCWGVRTPPGILIRIMNASPALLLRVDTDPLQPLDLAGTASMAGEVLRVSVYYGPIHLLRERSCLIFSTLSQGLVFPL